MKKILEDIKTFVAEIIGLTGGLFTPIQNGQFKSERCITFTS